MHYYGWVKQSSTISQITMFIGGTQMVSYFDHNGNRWIVETASLIFQAPFMSWFPHARSVLAQSCLRLAELCFRSFTIPKLGPVRWLIQCSLIHVKNVKKQWLSSSRIPVVFRHRRTGSFYCTWYVCNCISSKTPMYDSYTLQLCGSSKRCAWVALLSGLFRLISPSGIT